MGGLGVALGVVLFDNLFSSPCLWRRPKKGQRKVTWKVTFRSIFCTISSVRFLYVFCTMSGRFLNVFCTISCRKHSEIDQTSYRKRTEIVQKISYKILTEK